MRIILFFTVALFIDSCSNGSDKPATNNDTAVTVAVAGDSISTAVHEQEQERKYSERNISISKAAWPALKQKTHVNDAAPSQQERITGDFNGDGTRDEIWMIPAVADTAKDAFQDCFGGQCNSYVFNNGDLPVLIVHDNLGGEIEKIDDMDGDGAPEIIVYPQWWQSNWNPYRIYSFNKNTGQWNYLAEPVSIFANELYEKKILVKRSPTKGFIIAYTSDTDTESGDIESAYKTFPIIKRP